MSAATVKAQAATPATFARGVAVTIRPEAWPRYPVSVRGRVGLVAPVPPRVVGNQLRVPVRFGRGPAFVEVRAAHLVKAKAVWR